tara:strand:+ start:16426 stop:17592 length:1167 start_codon:yes stop_codon:yes gene_type:complete
MKRIHIISPFLSRFGGGVFTVIKALYNTKSQLTKKNSSFYIWGYKDDFCENDCISIKGKKSFFNYKFKFINKIFYSPEFKGNLFNEIKDGDIVHLHSLWLYPSVMFKSFKKNKIKKIISPHGMLDSWALKNNSFKKNISLILFERKNLRTADCIHALCEKEFQDIKKIATEVPIAIIPNGVYLPKLKNKEQKNNDVKRLLFLGRIHPKKGLTNLLKAWEVVSKIKKWELVIAGVDENGYESYLKKLSIEKNIFKSVKFVGPVFGKEKENLLLSADAFILPSFSEGLPMSVLEAWSYKLPVIMTPECNLEIGFQKGAAIEIDTTVIGITNGILELLEYDNLELMKKGELGYELVRKEFTWNIVSEKMEEVYLWLSGLSDKPDFVYFENK